MTMEPGYIDLLVAHQPGKPRDREELAEMTTLLESLAMNEMRQSPAIERFIETLTALILQYEQEIEPGPVPSPNGVLQYLMEEHKVRQVDLIPLLGTKSYVSQIVSGRRPIGKEAAIKLAQFFGVTPDSFLSFGSGNPARKVCSTPRK